MAKLNISLDPHNAICLLAFMQHFINEDLPDDYKYRGVREALQQYEQEIGTNITKEQLIEVEAVNEVNKLIGKTPS